MNGKSGSYIIVKAESGKEVKFDFSAQKLDGANREYNKSNTGNN